MTTSGARTAIASVPGDWELPWPREGRLLRRPIASAILIPPVALYVGALLTVLGEATVGATTGTGWPVFRPVVLAALHIPLLYAIRALADGALDRPAAFWVTLGAAAPLAVLLDVALPGGPCAITMFALVILLSIVVQPLGRMWRQRWETHRGIEAVLVVARPEEAQDALLRLERVPGLRIPIALIPRGDAEDTSIRLGRPVYSDVEALPHMQKHAIVSSPKRTPELRPTIAQLVARGFEVASVSAVVRNAEGRVDSDLADPLNLLMSRPRRSVLDGLSRLMGYVIAVPSLILMAPVFLILAIVIRLDSPGPVFYLQRRVGARGRPFRVIKFRTMVEDAETMSGPMWAQEADPRVTRVGAFLRRYRLDELPQLFNVVLGQMMLVGPRPERAVFNEALRTDVPIFELRTAVPPGITGWAQIRVPYAADVDQARVKLDHDLFYLSRRSPWFDLAILFETVAIVLGGRGAR